MKKIISSMFFMLVILLIFSQGYADWESEICANLGLTFTGFVLY